MIPIILHDSSLQIKPEGLVHSGVAKSVRIQFGGWAVRANAASPISPRVSASKAEDRSPLYFRHGIYSNQIDGAGPSTASAPTFSGPGSEPTVLQNIDRVQLGKSGEEQTEQGGISRSAERLRSQDGESKCPDLVLPC